MDIYFSLKYSYCLALTIALLLSLMQECFYYLVISNDTKRKNITFGIVKIIQILTGIYIMVVIAKIKECISSEYGKSEDELTDEQELQGVIEERNNPNENEDDPPNYSELFPSVRG